MSQFQTQIGVMDTITIDGFYQRRIAHVPKPGMQGCSSIGRSLLDHPIKTSTPSKGV